MEPSEPLRTRLENRAQTYTGREVEVQFDEQPRITPEGLIYVWSNPADVLGIDMSPANELRVIRDALNHEAAHDRYSDLSGKADFSARYRDLGQTEARLAGTVLNILEDSYIDSRRLARWPGLRHARAFFIESQLGEADVSEQSIENALVNSIHYLSLGGRVPGIRDAPDEVREFAAFAKPHIEHVRRADDVYERESIAARVVDTLIDYLPERPDLDDLLDELADEVSGEVSDGAGAEPSDVDPEDAPDSLPPSPLDDEADKWRDEDERDDADDGAGEGAGEPADEGDESDESGDESGSGEDEGDESDEDADGGEDAEGAGEGDEADDGDGEGGDDGDAGEDGGDTSGEKAEDGDGAGDALDELDDLDERGENPEFHGVDADEDYENPTAGDERRYENVEREIGKRHTDMGDRRRRRDDRAQSGITNGRKGDLSSDTVRQVLRETGIADDVVRAFEKFKNQKVTVSGESGDRLDLDAAIRHMSGDYGETNVYETEKTGATGGRSIAVALDTSNSMDDDAANRETKEIVGESFLGTIAEAKVALGAIHIAAETMGDELAACEFSGSSSALVTGPDEKFEWDHLDSVTAGGSTPTAHGVLDAAGLASRQAGDPELVLVVTDGIPMKTHPGFPPGKGATGHAAMAVESVRASGTKVIGIAVGNAIREHSLDHVFGSDGWVRTASDTLVEELVEVYVNQLDHDELPPGYV